MIAIIDYRAGNLTSVARAVRRLGYECSVTDEHKEIIHSERVIFPGVGAAGKAMSDLKALGLDRVLRDVYASGKPMLGICLGTQIIFEHSDEDDTPCLGILPGVVRRFPEPLMDPDTGIRLKVPHMGWNGVDWLREHPVFSGVDKDASFYFVHSYYPAPSEEDLIVGRTLYGVPFASAVARGNLVAVQFHPEKSGRPGLNILSNFCKWDPDHA